MLRIGDIADGKRQNVFSIFGDFVLLLVPRGSDLVAAVEHFLNFLDFCSTFEAARLSFEEPGRQKSGIYPETKNDRAFDTIVR